MNISDEQAQAYADEVRRESFCIMPGVFSTELMDEWNAAFLPLLHRHIETEGQRLNRGPGRYYVTLPFVPPFADPQVFENDAILAVVANLIGEDGVLCQLATDTPLEGSEYQEVHRDSPGLFPESSIATPPYQLAVNFPLVDVTPENGPIEIVRGSHKLEKIEALRQLETGEIQLEPVYMQRGDVMIRDVRHLHRGTPNAGAVPRPMVVLGYSRKWLFRPEVSIRVPRQTYDTLSERARFWLRYNPVVEKLEDSAEEVYQAFAY